MITIYVEVKATGEKKTAQYITTASGNKRMSVDGKIYTDRQFSKLFTVKAESDLDYAYYQDLAFFNQIEAE